MSPCDLYEAVEAEQSVQAVMMMADAYEEEGRLADAAFCRRRAILLEGLQKVMIRKMGDRKSFFDKELVEGGRLFVNVTYDFRSWLVIAFVDYGEGKTRRLCNGRQFSENVTPWEMMKILSDNL